MRRRTVALVGIAILAFVAFAFFAPVVSVTTNFAECGYGCFSHYQYTSLTGALVGHGGYYFEGHYSVH